jgi:hypothetical protein
MKPIGSAYKVGGAIQFFDDKGQMIRAIGVGADDDVVSCTSTAVAIRRGNSIITYDAAGQPIHAVGIEVCDPYPLQWSTPWPPPPKPPTRTSPTTTKSPDRTSLALGALLFWLLYQILRHRLGQILVLSLLTAAYIVWHTEINGFCHDLKRTFFN